MVCAVDASQIGEYRSQYLCDWDGVDCTGLGVAPSVLDALGRERRPCLEQPVGLERRRVPSP